VEGHHESKAMRVGELLTIIGASAIFVYLAIISYVGLARISTGSFSDQKPEVIYVVGEQYDWRFIYPNGTVSINNVYIYANKTYEFVITSRDVIHSFYIPQLGIKFQAVPGFNFTIYIKVDKPGTYDIWCAEFCGPGHYLMLAKMTVLPPP